MQVNVILIIWTIYICQSANVAMLLCSWWKSGNFKYQLLIEYYQLPVSIIVSDVCESDIRSSNSIVGYAVVYILRLIGHTHDRESPIQNFSTAPKKLGAHISSPVWPPKPTEFVSYLVHLRCDAFTELKSVQSARNESFLAGSDNFHRVLTAIEFEA